MNNYYFTFDLSKSGVSSVVVWIGALVPKIPCLANRDAVPAPEADACDACNKSMDIQWKVW